MTRPEATPAFLLHEGADRGLHPVACVAGFSDTGCGGRRHAGGVGHTLAESGGFLAELKRRNVVRMAGLYLVGAWLVTQVAGTLLPMFDAPAWIARAIVFKERLAESGLHWPPPAAIEFPSRVQGAAQ